MLATSEFEDGFFLQNMTLQENAASLLRWIEKVHNSNKQDGRRTILTDLKVGNYYSSVLKEMSQRGQLPVS